MYQQFYNLSAEPFRLSPDHAFAYAHKGYSKARAYMAYAFMRAEGFVMITGRPGTGKTTLVGALLDELAGENVSVANLVCTQVKADDLLKLTAYEFGIAPTVVEKAELLQALTQRFKAWHRDGRRALLIVDEAQDLSISAMEELRLLTNIQLDGRPLLQIFLLGQPELRELILSPQLEQVHQRIIAASHLQPLECSETEAYIRHRLQAVNWCGDPDISNAVYPLIFKFSDGVPRRINLICSRLLLHCAVEQRHQVELADLKVVVQELQEENLAAGATFSERDFQPAGASDQNLGGAVHAAPTNAPGQALGPPAKQKLVDNQTKAVAKPVMPVTQPGSLRVATQGAAAVTRVGAVTGRNLAENPGALAIARQPAQLTDTAPRGKPVPVKQALQTPPSVSTAEGKTRPVTGRPPANVRPSRIQSMPSEIRLPAHADQSLGDGRPSQQTDSRDSWATTQAIIVVSLAIVVSLTAVAVWAMLGSSGGAGY